MGHQCPLLRTESWKHPGSRTDEGVNSGDTSVLCSEGRAGTTLGVGTTEGVDFWDTSVPCSEKGAGSTLGMGQVRLWIFGTPVSPAWLRAALSWDSAAKHPVATSVYGTCGVSAEPHHRC